MKIRTLLIGTILAWPALANAELYVSPAHNGKVLMLDVPEDWTTKVYPSTAVIGLTAIRPDGALVHIDIHDREVFALEAPPWEQFVAQARDKVYFEKQKIYSDQIVTFMGEQALEQTLSQPAYWDAENQRGMPLDQPSMRVIYTNLWQGRLEATFILRAPNKKLTVFPQAEPDLTRVLASLRIVPLDQLPPEIKPWSTVQTKTALISRRRDFYINSDITMSIAPDWQASAPEIENANPPSEQGLLQFIVEHPQLEGDTSPAVLLIALEGLPFRSLTRQDFVNAARAAKSRIAPQAALISSQEIEHEGNHFLAHMNSRHSDATEATIVETYAGQDLWGNQVKLRLWAAGGLTMLARYVFVCPSHRFDELLPEVEQMIDSIRMMLNTPMIPGGP